MIEWPALQAGIPGLIPGGDTNFTLLVATMEHRETCKCRDYSRTGHEEMGYHRFKH